MLRPARPAADAGRRTAVARAAKLPPAGFIDVGSQRALDPVARLEIRRAHHRPLALDRTRLAAERTLMAWIRTSTSLIAFGFTIFKFFQYLATEEHRHHPIMSSWAVGMVMIVIGLTALTLAWFQHRQELKALRAQDATMPYSLAGVMAGLIAALGLFALVVVAWRL